MFKQLFAMGAVAISCCAFSAFAQSETRDAAVRNVRVVTDAAFDDDEEQLVERLSASQQKALSRGTPSKMLQRKATSPAQSFSSPQLPFLARIDNTPDISQHVRWSQLDPSVYNILVGCDRGNDPLPGKHCPTEERVMPKNRCGPSSLVNNLVWLDRTHFQAITDIDNMDAAAYDMILSGLDGYWGYSDIVNNAADFLHARLITPKAYRIISSVDRSDGDYNTKNVPFTYSVRPPKMHEVKSALQGENLVMVLWGFYEAQTAPFQKVGAPVQLGMHVAANAPVSWEDTWVRTGGHWVAPVGFGRDDLGDNDPSVLIYHNSAGSGHLSRAQEYISYTTLQNLKGNPVLAKPVTKTGSIDTELCPQFVNRLVECRAMANGHLIAGGAPLPSDDEVALIEGLIVIEF